MKDWWSGKW